jgi:hypothetical protein
VLQVTKQAEMSFVFKILLTRFVNVCRVVEGDTADAEAFFRKLYKRLFKDEELDLSLVAPLFEATVIDAHDVVDLILLTAANVSLDADAYGAIYWAAFLLVCVRDLVGKRLMHCMETHGFVSDTDFESAARRMAEDIRDPTVWDYVQNYTDQLCVALTQPDQWTIAGVYNSIIDRCRLPEAAAEQTATMSMMRKLLRKYFSIAKYKARIQSYVTKNIEQTATRTIYLNGSVEPVVLDVQGLVEVGRTPIFSSPLACIDFALACAQDLFLSPNKAQPAEWYLCRFQIVKSVEQASSSSLPAHVTVHATTHVTAHATKTTTKTMSEETTNNNTRGGFTSIEDRNTVSLLHDMRKAHTRWSDVIEEESAIV